MVRPARSQRQPQASQSQPHRATQGGRSRRARVSEEPEGENIDVDLEEEEEGGESGQGVSYMCNALFDP